MSLASGEVNMKRKSGPNIEPCEDPTDRALPWILNSAKEYCSSNAEAMISNPAGFSWAQQSGLFPLYGSSRSSVDGALQR